MKKPLTHLPDVDYKNELEERIADLEDKLAAAKSTIEQLRKTIDELKGSNGCTREALQQAEAECAELRATIEAVEHEVAKVYDDITGGKFTKCNTLADFVLDEVRAREARNENYIEELRATIEELKLPSVERVQEIYEIASLRAIIDELVEAGDVLNDVASSYAMQTYDRSGNIGRSIEAWREVVAKAKGTK